MLSEQEKIERNTNLDNILVYGLFRVTKPVLKELKRGDRKINVRLDDNLSKQITESLDRMGYTDIMNYDEYLSCNNSPYPWPMLEKFKNKCRKYMKSKSIPLHLVWPTIGMISDTRFEIEFYFCNSKKN